MNYFVHDTFADTMTAFESYKSAFNFVRRLEDEDKYNGLFVPNRYRIKRRSRMTSVVINKDMVHSFVSSIEKEMIRKTGKIHLVCHVRNVKGAPDKCRVSFSEM